MSSDQDIHLAVYDLSRGMASQMSAAFLGERIEMIPHTGIRAFNREWYFGGGVQVSPIGSFEMNTGLYPVRVTRLGRTTKTEAELRSFLASVNFQWTAQSYNLLNHNCNNFSDAVSKFLLDGVGIPSEIVHLPDRVFSTPIGQMIRPMVDGMQQQLNSNTAHTFDPFGGNVRTSFPATAPVSAVPSAATATATAAATGTATATATATTSRAATALASATGHPLAGRRAKLDDAPFLSAVSDGSASMVSRICNLRAKVVTATATPSSPTGKHGTCTYCRRDNFLTVEAYETHEREKPCKNLLSQTAAADGHSASKNSDAKGELLVEEEDRATLLAAQAWLDDPASHNFPENVYGTLISLCLKIQQAQTPALFLLRILVVGDKRLKEDAAARADVSQHMMRLVEQLAGSSSSAEGEGLRLRNVSAIVMALCSVSNWLGSMEDITEACAGASLDLAVDVAVTYLAHERVEVRQIAAALAYNFILHFTRKEECHHHWVDGGELHSHVVQLLCCSLESLSSEQDSVVRKRKLALSLRLLRSCGKLAAEFVRELGFNSSFKSIKNQLKAAGGATLDSEVIILEDLIYVTRDDS
eukprot:GSChrysophyteH1.ASY1.ANO1.1568.1 assembled CDS